MESLKINCLAIINIFLFCIITVLNIISSIIEGLIGLLLFVLGLFVIYFLGYTIAVNEFFSVLSLIPQIFILILVLFLFGVIGFVILMCLGFLAGVLTTAFGVINYVWLKIANVLTLLLDSFTSILINKAYIPIHNTILKSSQYECFFTSIYQIDNDSINVKVKINKNTDIKKCFCCIFVNILALIEVLISIIFNQKKWFELLVVILIIVGILMYQNHLSNLCFGMGYIKFLSYFSIKQIIVALLIYGYIIFGGYIFANTISNHLNSYLDFANTIVERNEILV
ncbi:MAG: hypothetical protein ACLSSU_10355 [Beduini sp.]